MTVELETWLKQAARHLSSDATAQVRAEIQEHYEAARESAMNGGATGEEADRAAVAALGDAKTANRQYRKVLLTSDEAGLLREGNWEARAVCSRLWLKWMFLALPLVALAAAGASFLAGSTAIARVLLIGGIGMSILCAAPFLPIYTQSRARVFRPVKWMVLTAMLGLAFGADALKWSWLLVSCLWPMAWIEWRRISIRRKLPVAKWPKQLYL